MKLFDLHFTLVSNLAYLWYPNGDLCAKVYGSEFDLDISAEAAAYLICDAIYQMAEWSGEQTMKNMQTKTQIGYQTYSEQPEVILDTATQRRLRAVLDEISLDDLEWIAKHRRTERALEAALRLYDNTEAGAAAERNTD